MILLNFIYYFSLPIKAATPYGGFLFIFQKFIFQYASASSATDRRKMLWGGQKGSGFNWKWKILYSVSLHLCVDLCFIYLFVIRDFGIFLVYFFAFIWFLYGVLSYIWVYMLYIELKVINWVKSYTFFKIFIGLYEWLIWWKTTSFLGHKWYLRTSFYTTELPMVPWMCFQLWSPWAPLRLSSLLILSESIGYWLVGKQLSKYWKHAVASPDLLWYMSSLILKCLI